MAQVVRLRLDALGGGETGALVKSALGHLVVLAAMALVAAVHDPAPELTAPGSISVNLAAGPPVPAAPAPSRREPPRRTQPARPRPEPPKPETPAVVPPEPARAEPEPEPDARGIAPPEEVEPPPRPAPPRRTPRREPEPAPQGTPGPDAGETDDAADDGSGIEAVVGGGSSGPGDPYVDALVRRVSGAWVKPRTGLPSRPVVIVFDLARNGRASNASVEATSGSASFDRAALRATELASPYPPIPASRSAPSLRVHFQFVP